MIPPLSHSNPISLKLLLSISICSLVSLIIYCYALSYCSSRSFNHFIIDDAYIAFRYLDNLLTGKGLVYNEGEYVDGYTSILWILLLAPFAKIGFSVENISQIVGILSTVGILVLLFSIATASNKKSTTSITGISLVLFIICPGIPLTAMNGLETMFFIFLILSGFYVFILSSLNNALLPLCGIIFGLATLARPEGLLFLVCSLVFCGWHRKGKTALRILAFFLSVYIPYFIWHYYYYGALLPNTFYAKTGVDYKQFLQGIYYIGQSIYQAGIVIPALSLFLPLIYRKRLNNSYIYLWYLSSVLYLIYVVYVGGDWMYMRFFLPVLPFFYLICLDVITKLFTEMRFQIKATFIIITISAVFCFQAIHLLSLKESLIIGTQWEQSYRKIYSYIKTRVLPTETIAATGIGGLGYKGNYRIIDMLGLADAHIARMPYEAEWKITPGHQKTDAQYILSRQPDYIILGWALSKEPMSKENLSRSLPLLPDQQLWALQTFHENYLIENVKIDDFYFYWFCKKS